MSAPAVAAYGLRFDGLESGRWLAVAGAAHWPQVSCEVDGRAEAPEMAVDIDKLELRLRADISHSELVHPLLQRVSSHLALARGHHAMHAGAVIGSAGAWVVVGPKYAGKSTLLASLAKAGTPVLTDDVLVFGAGMALAGPRCIDLRPDMRRFGLGASVRPRDPRNRIELAPIAAEHPLAGVIHLEWSSADTAIEPLHHRDALNRLLEVRGENGWPRDPRALLDLAALPTFSLRRPRSTIGLHASNGLMRSLVFDDAAGDLPQVGAPSLIAA
jgi:hypothetical protein